MIPRCMLRYFSFASQDGSYPVLDLVLTFKVRNAELCRTSHTALSGHAQIRRNNQCGRSKSGLAEKSEIDCLVFCYLAAFPAERGGAWNSSLSGYFKVSSSCCS